MTQWGWNVSSHRDDSGLGCWFAAGGLTRLVVARARPSAERIGGGNRKGDRESRASPLFILCMHATPVPFHDRSHDGETHPEALRLRGKEWLEGTQLRLGRQAWTAISHEDLHLLSACRRSA